MILKRQFLLCSAAVFPMLSVGCIQLPVGKSVVDLPETTVDVHVHIFNARDIPVTGFLTQVVLRKDDAPVGTGAYNGLINLIKNFLFSGTLTARSELAKMRSENSLLAETLDENDLLKQDQEKFARAVQKFEEQTLSGPRVQSVNKTSDVLMLDELYRAAGINQNARMLSSTRNNAALIAASVYQPAKMGLMALRRQNPSLGLLLRWAMLLRRDRRNIVTRLKHLYGKIFGDGSGREVSVFSPSIVDFEYWLKYNENDFSPINTQVEVMSEIAKREKDIVLLNFVAFCPLRAALLRKKGKDPLAVIKKAISKERGFVGIKLYPPMGFQPIGNSETAQFGAKQGYKVYGRRINDELENLYGWCVDNQVPIKTHGNNSIAARPGSGCNSSPEYWDRVLSIYPNLHVNFAHFGGFDETKDGAKNCDPNVPVEDWDEIAARISQNRNRFYLDLGFWDGALLGGDTQHRRIIDKTRTLIAAYPKLKKRIMYGSDWTMIGIERNHAQYLAKAKLAITQIGLPLERVMKNNALSYLNIKPGGAQFDRLSHFFPADHTFHKMFQM